MASAIKQSGGEPVMIGTFQGPVKLGEHVVALNDYFARKRDEIDRDIIEQLEQHARTDWSFLSENLPDLEGLTFTETLH